MKLSICKWLLRSTFSAILITGAANAQAQTSAEEPGAALTEVQLQQIVPGQSKFRLQFNNPTPGKVEITISDAMGNALFHTKIKDRAFVQTFDLSTLQDGTYTFSVIKGREVIKKTVALNTDYLVLKQVSIK